MTDEAHSKIVCFGYNGRARGERRPCPGEPPGKCGCVHAETNALVKMGGGSNLILYCTQSPCEECARLIINCGAIYKVVYLEAYRSTLGLSILQEAGVVTYEWQEC